jgi:cytochrome c nitrite reductase small subunit
VPHPPASMRTFWRGLAAGAVGTLAGAGVYTFDHAEGLSYMSNDPQACVNCHVMRDQYDGWQKSAHHAFATCNDCHVPHDLVGKYMAKAVHGWRHSKAFTLQDFHEPIRITSEDAAIVRENCVRCHEPLVESVLAGRTDAAAAARDGHASETDCLMCHKGVGHGPR